MDKVRIYIESESMLLREANPVFSGKLIHKKEKGKVYYSYEMSDSLKFNAKEDFDAIMAHSSDECAEINIYIDKKCNGEYSRHWSGFFTMFNTKQNREKCFIEVKPKAIDAYKCFDQAIKEEVGLFLGNTVEVISTAGDLEEKRCFDLNTEATMSDYFSARSNPLNACLSNTAQWCIKVNSLSIDGIDYTNSLPPATIPEPFALLQETIWFREVIESNSPPPIGGSWEQVEDQPGTPNSPVSWWRCPPGGTSLGPYRRGKMLSEVIENSILSLGCSLAVKSDFFGINPIGDSPINDAYTFAENKCRHISMHQKSDIKRKNNSNLSSGSAWIVKMSDFINDLKLLFNVDYVIEDGIFILEHVSFFTSQIGLDLTGATANKVLDFSGGEDVSSEKFYFSDEKSSIEFQSNKIQYSCGSEDRDMRCVLISTDLAYIENEDNSEKINDDGFVLVSNSLYGGELVVDNANIPFSWPELQDSLHKHNRLYKSGSINGTSQEFESWLPYIKQDKFKIDLPCDFNFRAKDLITTDLGIATIDTAETNLFTGKLDLQLMY